MIKHKDCKSSNKRSLQGKHEPDFIYFHFPKYDTPLLTSKHGHAYKSSPTILVQEKG